MPKSERAQVTIIIPSKNRFGFLAETLASVVSQGIPLKIIIVDDSDEAGLENLISKYRSDLDITVISALENRGIGHKRNIGLASTQTPFVVFLDSDDKMRSGFLSCSLNELNRNSNIQGTICLTKPFFHGQFSFGKKCKILVFNLIKKILMLLPSSLPARPLPKSAPFLAQISHMVFRTNGLPKFDETMRYAEDWMFVYSVLKNGSIRIIPKSLIDFRYSATSYSFKSGPDIKMQKAKGYQILIDAIKKDFPNSLFLRLFQFYSKRLILD